MALAFDDDSPRALITGINGFTGQYLARELEASGYQVYGLAHADNSENSRVFTCDLEDKKKLSDVVKLVNPKVVAHLAAVSYVAHEDADAIYRTNIIGTRNLLQALSGYENSLKKVLLASSANIYGNSINSPILESENPKPENDYAVSKMAMESMARLWFDRLPIVITRPFNYTGVGQGNNFLIPKIVDHFKKKEKIIELGNIDVERDFSDVRDVVKIYSKLLEDSGTSEIYNICSGKSIAIKEIIDQLSDIAEYDIEVVINPNFVRKNEIIKLVGSDEKLRLTIGEREKVSLNETLRWMYESD
jgi:nucleoside-diphosphate-sugar epimerase